MAKKNASPAAKPAIQAQPAKGSTLEAKPSTNTPTPVTHDEIAKAAFLRWQSLGGDPESNWLAAERDLNTKR